jgi:phosphoglycerate kinase
MIDLQAFQNQLQRIFTKDSQLNSLSLETILDAIPEISELTDLQSGTVVLVRTDIDVPIKEGLITDLSRIRASVPTVKYCRDKNLITVIIGHIGRDRNNTALPVCQAMSDSIGSQIEFIDDWLDEKNNRLTDACVEKIKAAQQGDIFMLENTRKYLIEQALWNADQKTLPAIGEQMYTLCKDIRERLSGIEINEAIAASNMDFSSVAIPLLMAKTGMGFNLSFEMRTYVKEVRKANLVVFSGLKMDKLNDLEGVVERGKLKLIIVAGALAIALKKADALLKGTTFSAGEVEVDTTNSAYLEPRLIEQAKRIIQICTRQNIELVLPIDFILDNNQTSKDVPEERVQLDIGPETRKLFTKKVRQYIQESKSATEEYVMFYNGVFGKFEDERFAKGTKTFISLLKEMTKAGIKTYVGGGEGRTALIEYGSLNDVTHVFTAGGTILKSLTNEHIAYLKAMYLQNTQK